MRMLPAHYDAQRRSSGISGRRLAVAVLGVWMGPALLAGLETLVFWRMSGRQDPAWQALLLQTPGWLSYALLTPIILHAAESSFMQRRGRIARVMLHVPVALACNLVYATFAATTWHLFAPGERTFGDTVLSWYLASLPLAALSYAVVVGGARALYFFARSRDAEIQTARLAAQLSAARLDALRMQLHPHFLFNTLNAIAVLLRDRDAASAERALAVLSSLLRDSLRPDAQHLVPLAEEIDFIQRYLALEQIRFPDRLRVRVDVPYELSRVSVPGMILQPLVENAVEHGIRKHADAGLIEIIARADDTRLVITVTDDGGGALTHTDGRGLGLANTRERLRVLYGDAASLALHERDGRGMCSVIRIPVQVDSREATSPVRRSVHV